MLFCGLNVCLHAACLQPNEAVGFSCHWFATQCAVWRKSAAQTGWAERRNCLMRSLSLCSTLKLFSQSLCLSHLIHAHTHMQTHTHLCEWAPPVPGCPPESNLLLIIHCPCISQAACFSLSLLFPIITPCSPSCVLSVHSLSPDRKVPEH